MKNVIETFKVLVASQITFVITSFYAFGITPILLYSNGIIPGSELVLASYWVTVVTSLAVITLTLLRWLVKYPTRLTWMQGGLGVVAINSLIYSYAVLKTVYNGEAGMPGSTVAILATVVLIITIFAIYLTRKAVASRFKN